jgi:hypothetical protein
MKTKLLIFALIIASCFFKTATAQVVTSVAGLDFGTEYNKAKSYLTNHFGWNNYATKGNYMLRFNDVMVGGINYDNAEFYFQNNKFVAARFYTGFPLSQLNAAKLFRDQIFSRYKEKYSRTNKPYTSSGFQCYAFGDSMYFSIGNSKYPIYVTLYKANNTEGTMMYYWVECEYYMQHFTNNNDDI